MYRKKICPNSTDFGPMPFVVNIACETEKNPYYRRAIWTGSHLQVTLMCIPPCGQIGLEVHPENDQFLHIEQGKGIATMGTCSERIDFEQNISQNDAIIIPAGTWHNIINTGTIPLKLYSIYGPPHHPHGIIHPTKADADNEYDQEM